jgi:nucleotide-binding universal stress UspA family protein
LSASTPIAPPGTADPAAGSTSDTAPAHADDPPAREVVVGVDGSECGLRAVRWAAHEAAERNAPLRIVHAASYLGRRGVAGAPPPELARARQITGQAYTVARHTERDLPATTEVVPGDPVGTLLRAAESGQLVVLGSSTTGAADELVLAPVAARLAARSPLPVVVVPRQRRSTPVGRPVVAVLGIGDPEDDEEVARFAATAAHRTSAPLAIVQTRSAGHTETSWTDDLGEWSRREPELEVTRTEVPHASAGQLLTAASPTPLLVLSAGHGHLLHRTLDGPHRWLLRHCTSPMALVPPVRRREPASSEENVVG